MELGKLIIFVIVALLLLLLILFPEFRKLLMGWTRLFIKDMATTPEGAEAIYEEKINEAQEKYNKADHALRIAAGKLHVQRENLSKLEQKLRVVETQCETLVKNGDMESATIKAEERAETLSDIQRTKTLINAYAEAEKEAKQVHKACEDTLRRLKRESKDVVENMRIKSELNQVYDSMDDLKATTATDKLITSIREKNEDLNASVAGAKVIHESKTSTKIQKVNEKAKKLQNDNYLEELKKKYNH